MNILMLLGCFRTSAYKGAVGGGEISNVGLASKLVEHGNSVTVYTLHSDLEDFSSFNGVKIRKAKKSQYKSKLLSEIYGRINYKKMIKKDICNSNYNFILSGPDTLELALLLAREYKIEVGCFVRAYENFNVSENISVVDRLKSVTKNIIRGNNSFETLKQMDFIITNSNYMKEYCHSQGFNKDIQVVYPALELVNNIKVIEKKIKNVTMIGTKKYKGHFIVEELAGDFPMLNFNIIGCPDDLVRSNGPKNLNYIGWCDVINYFNNSTDIVVVPSQWDEPFGRVAIEGLSCGNITIVSDKGGLPETVSNIEKLIVADNDINKWKSKVKDILSNQSLYVDLSNMAQESLPLYTLDKQTLVLHDFLSKRSKPVSKQ